jgi:hypothetical protein
MRLRLPDATRRGTVLVYFALSVFVFLGLAALTIDLGLTFGIRRQVQTATDFTALELAGNPALGTLDPGLSFVMENVLPSNTVDFTGGIALDGSAFNASALLSLGTYPPPAVVLHPGGDYLAGTGILHTEKADPSTTGDNVRDDFDRVTPVRQDAAEASVAATAPYLFSRGLFFQSATKVDAVTVRTTAIATPTINNVDATGIRTPLDVGRVKSVGRPFLVPASTTQVTFHPGVAPFVLNQTAWNGTGFPIGQAVPVSVRASDSHLLDGSGNDIGVYGIAATVLGQSAVAIPTTEDLPQYTAANIANLPLTFYAPVVQPVPLNPPPPAGQDPNAYVAVGFGVVTIAPGSITTGPPLTFSFTKLAGAPVPRPENASAAWPFPANGLLAVSDLLAAHAALTNPLRTPVLVLTTGPKKPTP